MPNHDVEMDPLVDALTRLAAPAEQQIVELLRRGSSVWVDELALGYDEAVQLVIGERGVALPFATLDLLEDVDELLTSLAGDPDAWTPTALLDRDEWRGDVQAPHRDAARGRLPQPGQQRLKRR